MFPGKAFPPAHMTGRSLLKQIQHIIKIDFFPDTKLILRLRHIIKKKLQYQCTAKSPAFNLEVGKSHRQIHIPYVVNTDKSRIFHCSGKAIALPDIRCLAGKIRTDFPKILSADCFVAAFSVFTPKETALITQKFYLVPLSVSAACQKLYLTGNPALHTGNLIFPLLL